MKTRHKANKSWSIVKSKTLRDLHLEMTTPKALQTMMNLSTDTKLVEAKEKYRVYLSRLSPPVTVTVGEIKMELVNIPCGFKLYNNTTGEGKVLVHLRNSHKIILGDIRPSFTRGSDCKPYKPLDKIKSLPKPLTLPVITNWAEDTFAEFREQEGLLYQ